MKNNHTATIVLVSIVSLFVASIVFLLGFILARAIEAEESGLSDGEIQLLFAVTGEDASFNPNTPDNDDFALVIEDVDSQVTFFTDRPDRVTGTVSPEDFIETAFVGQDPPNAVVVGQTLDEGEVTFAVELTRPVYNKVDGTMSFRAFPLDEELPGTLQHYNNSLTTEYPDNMTHVALFVDNSKKHKNDTDTDYICTVNVRNNFSGPMTRTSLEPGEGDGRYLVAPPSSISAGSVATIKLAGSNCESESTWQTPTGQIAKLDITTDEAICSYEEMTSDDIGQVGDSVTQDDAQAPVNTQITDSVTQVDAQGQCDSSDQPINGANVEYGPQ